VNAQIYYPIDPLPTAGLSTRDTKTLKNLLAKSYEHTSETILHIIKPKRRTKTIVELRPPISCDTKHHATPTLITSNCSKNTN